MNKRLQIYLFAIIALFSTSLSAMQIKVTYTTTVKDEKLNDGSIKRTFITTNNLNDDKIEYRLIISKDAPTANYRCDIEGSNNMIGAAVTNILLSTMINLKNIAKAAGIDIDMRLMPEINMISLSDIADARVIQSADPVKLQQQLLAQQQAPAQQAEAAPAQQESIMSRFIAALMGRQQQAPAQAAAAVAPIHPAQQAAAAVPMQAERAPIVARAILGAPGGPKIEEKKEEEPSN